MPLAIKTEDLWKKYRQGEIGTKTIYKDINRLVAKVTSRDRSPSLSREILNKDELIGDYFWALKSVNISIGEGNIVGLIGSNGSGKSTLLKLLSRITSPTKGRIKINGSVASLLEVGTGFHPELTGRENIFLNGSIMGMKKIEIKNKIETIINFSECGDHIDTPVKRYSSGMVVKLGFAIAAHLESDIVIVDEVLAVGDQKFRLTAVEKMKELAGDDGKTIIFVSHNMAVVKDLCESGIVIENGVAREHQKIDDALLDYLGTTDEEKLTQDYVLAVGQPGITRVSIKQTRDRAAGLTIELSFESPYLIDPVPGIVLYSDDLKPLVGSNTAMHKGDRSIKPCTNGKLTCVFDAVPLHEGNYLISFWLHNGTDLIDEKPYALRFYYVPESVVEVKPSISSIGHVNLRGDWSQMVSVDS